MAKKYMPLVKKLQKAINLNFDKKVLINKTQFYSQKSDKVIEMIVIKQAVWDAKKQKIVNVKLFESASDIQILLFMRDYWYQLNGWDIPNDNEYWEDVKKKKGI